MNLRETSTTRPDFAGVWRALSEWDHVKPRRLDFVACWVQLYMGAMEIPMVALQPAARVAPEAERLGGWQPLLDRFGLVLDCVTEGANYKLNRCENGEYVGRILPDSLKFHAVRVLGLGLEGFEEISRAYLALPPIA